MVDGVDEFDGGIRGALRGLFTFGIMDLLLGKREIVEQVADGESKGLWNSVLMQCLRLRRVGKIVSCEGDEGESVY